MTGHSQSEALLDVLGEPLAKQGYDLEGVEVSQAGRRSLVRVLVDTDNGVTLDGIADATHIISDVLDSTEVLGESPYTLEVTSPGIDRPLTVPRHWRRNVDRLVKVVPRDGDEFIGRIRSCHETAVQLETDSGSNEVAYDDITSARIQVEFKRPDPTGKR
ncbi:MAG: ribosome maturation factor RimP [Nocardioidaceae bacterium]|nr:ribosome maturation factor RimP [Nocardioidaceae bacterium]